jgi:regulator of extracellular matrix RemA (YlzA/DUF370 family)
MIWINATFGLLVPFAAFGAIKSTESADSNQAISDKQRDELIEALGNKKTRIGLDVVLSFGLGF